MGPVVLPKKLKNDQNKIIDENRMHIIRLLIIILNIPNFLVLYYIMQLHL
jgi:hypothetical protein